MDGNFAMAPAGFLQLYDIHIPLGATMVGTVYALLQRTSQDTYKELLHVILDYCTMLGLYPDPTTVLVDFEQSVIHALQAVLGDEVRGCFYHLTQATWRKIQELGLVPRYRDDEEFKLSGQLDALAFLPLDDITAGMMYLREITPLDAEPLVDYFDQTYVTGTYRHVRAGHGPPVMCARCVPPRFLPALWNVCEATIHGEPQTNNQCEGCNNRFTHLVRHMHPTIWVLIDAIWKEDVVASTMIMEDL